MAAVGRRAGRRTDPGGGIRRAQEIVVTARKRDESLQNVPVTEDAFTEQAIQVGGHRIAARLRRDGAEHDPGRGAERRQLVHHHPRHLAGAQQRALGRGAGRWRARAQSLRVRPGADRHHADRGAQGSAGRALRPRRHRRRDHHSDRGSGRSLRGRRQGRRRQRRVREGPAGRQRPDRRRPARCNIAPRSISTIPTAIWRTPISTARPTRIGITPGGCGWCGSPPINGARICACTAIASIPRAYYYVIPRADEANPFSSFTTPPNANDVTSPIQDNNLGTDHRDITDTALKLDYNIESGTFTSVSDFNFTKEIDTGDAYDFRPIKDSIAYNYFFAGIPAADGGPAGESQSQFISEKTESQELRFTSKQVNGFSWIAGAYYIHTQRFISTGNLYDRGRRRSCRL